MSRNIQNDDTTSLLFAMDRKSLQRNKTAIRVWCLLTHVYIAAHLLIEMNTAVTALSLIMAHSLNVSINTISSSFTVLTVQHTFQNISLNTETRETAPYCIHMYNNAAVKEDTRVGLPLALST